RYNGFTGENLDVLKEIPNIREVHIQDSVEDAIGLMDLKDLRYLLINAIGHDLDLSAFRNLQELRVTAWSKHHMNINKCAKLKSLYIYCYSPRTKNLSELAALEGLESLELVKGTVNALQGVTSMRALRKLDLRYLSLEDLSPLCGCKSLEQLELDHCKKIRDLSVLAGVKKLSI